MKKITEKDYIKLFKNRKNKSLKLIKYNGWSFTKSKYYCKKHKIYYDGNPKVALSGNSCPQCTKEAISHKVSENYRTGKVKTTSIGTTEFIRRSKIIHNNRYVYDKTIYTRWDCKVKIKCKKHGYFIQNAYDHLAGCGCPKCWHELPAHNRLSNKECIKRLKKLYGNSYDYSEVDFQGMDKDIILTHKKCGNRFKIKAVKVLNRNTESPCKKCKNYSQSSMAIDCIKTLGKISKLRFRHSNNYGEYQIKDTLYKVDGYNKKLNLILEFYGDYYHANPKVYTKRFYKLKGKVVSVNTINNKNKIRENTIKSKGFNLFIVWEYDWINNKETTIKKFMKYVEGLKK